MPPRLATSRAKRKTVDTACLSVERAPIPHSLPPYSDRRTRTSGSAGIATKERRTGRRPGAAGPWRRRTVCAGAHWPKKIAPTGRRPCRSVGPRPRRARSTVGPRRPRTPPANRTGAGNPRARSLYDRSPLTSRSEGKGIAARSLAPGTSFRYFIVIVQLWPLIGRARDAVGMH